MVHDNLNEGISVLGEIDHIGIAVQSLKSYHSLYGDLLGGAYLGQETVIDEDVRIAMYRFGVHSKVELLEPLGTDGAIAKHVRDRGEGIHHIAFTVEDIESSLKIAQASGYRPIPGYPKTGAHNCRVAFLHPKTTGKTLIELVQHQ